MGKANNNYYQATRITKESSPYISICLTEMVMQAAVLNLNSLNINTNTFKKQQFIGQLPFINQNVGDSTPSLH